MYIFTNKDATEILSIKDCVNGDNALIYREQLSKKLKQVVISWACMGMENPRVEIETK